MARHFPQSHVLDSLLRTPHRPFVLNCMTATVRAALALSLVMSSNAHSAPASQTAAPAGHGEDARRSFNLPSGPLEQTLQSFALAAGIRLRIDQHLVLGKYSAGLSGTYGVREGLAQLLHEHDLQAARQSDGSYALGRVGSMALPTVTVQGATAGGSHSYAGGQVGARGRVGMLGEKDFMETPFSTINYTDKFIADRQAHDLTDVISGSDPAVFNAGIAGASNESYTIRGFVSDIRDVAFDGLYGMAPYYRAAPEMFERIEVLKGPSALLNGMPPGGSVAGAINLVPKRATDIPVSQVTASFISKAQAGVHVDLGRRFGEDQAFGVRVNTLYRDGKTSTDQQKKHTELVALSLDWRGRGASVVAHFYGSEDRLNGINRGVNLAPGLAIPSPPKPESPLSPDWGYYSTRDRGAMLRGEVELNADISAYAAVGISKSEYKTIGPAIITVFNTAGDFGTIMADLSLKAVKNSAEAGLKGKFKAGPTDHEWSLNTTYYGDTTRQRAYIDVKSPPYVTNLYRPVWGPAAGPHSTNPLSHSETELTSIGVADTISFAEKRVQLTLGARHQEVITDQFNPGTGKRNSRYHADAISPAAALLFKATERLSLYANYIEGLSPGKEAPLTAPNAGQVFAPYKSKQKEVGLKLDTGEFAHTFSIYQITRPSGFTDPVTKAFSFGGEQRNRGFEWSFFGTPLPELRLMGGIGYVDPRLTKTAGGVNQGKLASGVPKWQAKLGVEWDAPSLRGLTLTSNVTSVGKQYFNTSNSLSIAGHTIYDAGLRYASSVAGHAVTLRGNVTNLTNKAYWAPPQYTALALGAPRTVQLSATIDF